MVLMSKDASGRFTSFFGDLHPSFFGNVVKAMGSAKQGYPVVSRVLERLPARAPAENEKFIAKLNDELRATVHAVHRLTPKIVEVSIWEGARIDMEDVPGVPSGQHNVEAGRDHDVAE